ncbi:Leucine aminopeptidase 1 [Bacidia gigantensis]|uniref:Leucine aminopeptidase 1 n=1 Tax=Bacidia gigantensis TaxID=2732470 RepID=UPI001D04E557|nr:Leucine aminopeptidase 1 [Bacidia gigantensis]KAG8531538.1 Leucine aminopeptidase 1 [Bacidia gigantensis]
MKHILWAVLPFAGVCQSFLTTPEAQAPISEWEAERFLIELSPGETRWVTEDEKWALRQDGKRFMDITNGTPGGSLRAAQKVQIHYPKKPAHNESVTSLLKKLDKANLVKNLGTFSSFHTRYYKSDYGAQSSAWLFEQVNGIVNATDAPKYGAKVEPFAHPWGQNSIIATIPGKSEQTIVIGAHQDSINLFLPSILAAPGADDDGSGTVTILEALRVILQSDAIVQGNASNTIEFHWYSAEEGGLLGSQAIFKEYEQQGRDIKAMLQQDMTGYSRGTVDAGKPQSVGIITDYVDPGLTDFMKAVVTEYCDIPFVLTKCGYACSDHASARKAGYPSAFVIESEFEYSDNRIHTTLDTLDVLDFDHMLQHARLTLGATYELAFADLNSSYQGTSTLDDL